MLLVSHDRELLRALTTRVWLLHDRHVTDFDGTFGEWELAAAEREHAAAVRSAEEEALRRVAEKRKTARREDASRDARAVLRVARREVQELEAAIQSIEERIEEITRVLEDPALYTDPTGIARATDLGSELERRRRELERALDAWGTASERVDRLTAPTS